MQSFYEYAAQYDPFSYGSIPGSPVIPSVISFNMPPNIPSVIYSAPPSIPPINFNLPPMNFPSVIQLDASKIPSQITLNWPTVQTDTLGVKMTMGVGCLNSSTQNSYAGTPLASYLGMVSPMGVGALGQSNIVFKRKFRWTLELTDSNGNKVLKPAFIKLTARPQVNVEETELNYLSSKTWIPGKRMWEEIDVTLYDVPNQSNDPLWVYLGKTYNATNTKLAADLTGELKLWDGCGCLIEEWKLGKAFVASVNFGELDYSSSEETTIELKLRYGEMQYKSATCPDWNGIIQRTPGAMREWFLEKKEKVFAYCPAARVIESSGL